MKTIDREEMTVKQFIDSRKGRWPTESALRSIILHSQWGRNNFQNAFIHVGKRVLIRPSEFWKCVDAMQEKH